jgi:hypothetical protein
LSDGGGFSDGHSVGRAPHSLDKEQTMSRFLFPLALVAGFAVTADGAELKKFVLKCVEKAEATPDDVFIEFIRDGQPVTFGKDGQKGTSKDNTVSMKNGDVLTLDPTVLAAVRFEKTLTIHIKDKDITRNEPIGTLNLVPGDVTNTYKTKGLDVGSYEYHADYATTK